MDTVDLVAGRIINLNMYNPDIGYYFLDDLFDTDFIKQLLINRFTLMWPKEFSKIDPGKIYTHLDDRATEICKSLDIYKGDILFCYEQKKEIYFAFTKEDAVVSKTPISIDWDLYPVKIQGIKCSEALLGLLRSLKRIKHDYVMKRINDGEKLQHPVKKSSRSECQFYIKLLSLFCNEYGFSSNQLLRIVELCCCFGISSSRFNQLFRIISEVPCGISDIEKILNSIYKSGVFSDKTVLITELLYMIYLGEYDINTEFNAVLRAGELTGISADAVLTIYDRIKENR